MHYTETKGFKIQPKLELNEFNPLKTRHELLNSLTNHATSSKIKSDKGGQQPLKEIARTGLEYNRKCFRQSLSLPIEFFLMSNS